MRSTETIIIRITYRSATESKSKIRLKLIKRIMRSIHKTIKILTNWFNGYQSFEIVSVTIDQEGHKESI